MYVYQKYTFGILIFCKRLYSCLLWLFFRYAKTYTLLFLMICKVCFCTYKNVKKTFVSVSICRRCCICLACRFLYAGVLGSLVLCYAFFRFSGTKVATHAAFVKGRFTLRVKNLLCSLRSCGIFYPSPLTNTLCFAGRCLGKKKKMLFFGVFCLFLYS